MARILALTAYAGHVVHTQGLQISSNSSIIFSYCSGLSLETFEEFVDTFEKEYSPEEYGMRKELFKSRIAHIASHNCADKHLWQAQVNHMADWTESELGALRGYKPSATSSTQGRSLALTNLRATADDDLPEYVSYGHLASIRRAADQGQCGSCWAYAAAATLDAHNELNNGSHQFAVGQILACTPNPNECGGTGGCQGATAELAFEYALQAQVVSQTEFPVEKGGKQPSCPEDKKPWGELARTGVSTRAVYMADGSEKHLIQGSSDAAYMMGRRTGLLGWTRFPTNKEAELVRALVNYGPIAIAVAAGPDWNWYFHGILTPDGCDSKNVISHAVVLYGYGKSMNVKIGEVKYWQIKNSWGRNWGEDGTMRLQRVDDEEQRCGWDNSPEVGSGCKGGPKQVWVCGSCGILFDTVMPLFRA
jgi:cathepsin L